MKINGNDVLYVLDEIKLKEPDSKKWLKMLFDNFPDATRQQKTMMVSIISAECGGDCIELEDPS